MDNKTLWDGNASTADMIIGERYGMDWEYLPGSASIKVGTKVYNVGDVLE